MSAGLPGVGLSGVFFIVSALLMVPLEIARTLRGRSSLARWTTVLQHLAIAATMIVCLELVYAALRLVVELVRSAPSHLRSAAPPHLHALPVAPVLATLGLLAMLLMAAKGAQLLARWRKSGTRAIIRSCCATCLPPFWRPQPRASGSRGPSTPA